MNKKMENLKNNQPAILNYKFNGESIIKAICDLTFARNISDETNEFGSYLKQYAFFFQGTLVEAEFSEGTNFIKFSIFDGAKLGIIKDMLIKAVADEVYWDDVEAKAGEFNGEGFVISFYQKELA